MKIFRSKIGMELVVPVVIILLCILFTVIKYANWFGLILVLLVMLFFIYLAVSTTYKIQNDILEIKCGIFINRHVNIQEITSIKSMTDIFAAPAISIKRIVISFKNNESIAISPKDKSAFIQTLLDINPGIVVI